MLGKEQIIEGEKLRGFSGSGRAVVHSKRVDHSRTRSCSRELLTDSKCAKILEMQEILECIIAKIWVRKKREGAEKREWKSETGKR